MSTLESKIGDFLFDTSCELGLKGNDLLQQCINILQQKMSKIKPATELTLQHPTPIAAQNLSIELPSSTRATPGSRGGFSPYASSAFSSRTPVIRAASKESARFMAQKEEEEEQLNICMDSEDVHLVDGLSDATICSNLTNDLAEQIDADNVAAAAAAATTTAATSATSAATSAAASNTEKPKRKRAPKPADPLKAAMKAKKDELHKEKQAQRLAKSLEKEAKTAEKEAKAAEKAKEKEKTKKTKEAAAIEEADEEPKRKPKRKVAEASSSSSAALATSSSDNAEPEKKRRRTRKALDVQAVAAKAVVIDDDDMFGDREEVADDDDEDERSTGGAEEDVEAEIEGFIDEAEEEEEEDEDGVSIDCGEVEDIWQKKVVDGKSYTISSMTNKVYNSSFFVVGERNPETGDIRLYSTSSQPSVYQLKA